MDEATNAIREGVRLGETGISNKLYGDHLKREREMYNNLGRKSPAPAPSPASGPTTSYEEIFSSTPPAPPSK